MRPGQHLEQIDGDNRYELTVEVEAGSRRDAADDFIVEYENAIGAYHPRLLAAIAPEPR